MRHVGLWLCVLTTIACKRAPDVSDVQERPPAEALPFAAGRLAAPGAFDLIATRDGPLLGFAQPRELGGAVIVRGLDARGVARGPERRILAQARVVEVELAALRERIGVAFLESDATSARTRALMWPLAGDAVQLEADTVAESGPVPARGRGHIALSAVGDASLRLMYPAGAADCAGADESACVGFGFRELNAAANAPRATWLSVPSPCPEGAASVASLAGRFFYAVCSWSAAAPQTTAYAINIETYYARADQVLPGCTPLGMLVLDDSSVLLGADCSAMRRAVRFTPDMRPPVELALGDAVLACEPGGPVIHAGGFSLVLDAPRDHLEALLPPSLVPTGSRALWTGRALLVAHLSGQQLEMMRHTCTNGALRTESCAGCRGG